MKLLRYDVCKRQAMAYASDLYVMQPVTNKIKSTLLYAYLFICKANWKGFVFSPPLVLPCCCYFSDLQFQNNFLPAFGSVARLATGQIEDFEFDSQGAAWAGGEFNGAGASSR